MAVAEHLDLDVARLGQVLLDQHAVVVEGRAGLPSAAVQGRLELVGVLDHAHALAAATGAGLEQHRIADGVGLALEQVVVLIIPVVARHQRDPGVHHAGLGGGLVAHGLDAGGGRADEDDTGVFAGADEGLVFRQETVAGMDSAGAAAAGRRDDLVDIEIAFPGRRRTDADRLIGFAHVARAFIGVGVHRHRLQAHGPGGGHDTTGDLATIGHQQSVEARLAV